MIVPLCKGKEEKTECSNYRGISLLIVVGKIYAGILVDRARKVIKGLNDDEQGGFRVRRGSVDQIFILKQIRRKHLESLWVLWTWRSRIIGSIGRRYYKY